MTPYAVAAKSNGAIESFDDLPDRGPKRGVVANFDAELLHALCGCARRQAERAVDQRRTAERGSVALVNQGAKAHA